MDIVVLVIRKFVILITFIGIILNGIVFLVCLILQRVIQIIGLILQT